MSDKYSYYNREKFESKPHYKYERGGIHRRCLKVSTYEYDGVTLVEICFSFGYNLK